MKNKHNKMYKCEFMWKTKQSNVALIYSRSVKNCIPHLPVEVCSFKNKHDNRICELCDLGKVEVESHFL